ncbi:hypothetical protein AMTR_s00001p00239100, partial [Amborella trichopoda]
VCSSCRYDLESGSLQGGESLIALEIDATKSRARETMDYAFEWLMDSDCSHYMACDHKKFLWLRTFKGNLAIVTTKHSVHQSCHGVDSMDRLPIWKCASATISNKSFSNVALEV